MAVQTPRQRQAEYINLLGLFIDFPRSWRCSFRNIIYAVFSNIKMLEITIKYIYIFRVLNTDYVNIWSKMKKLLCIVSF
ncbi:hypothetical protein MERGE_002579 [Pneumocystis wakefieldiae]|uniref:Uncharacterized protein n=1 Tax=Pneumocystis wakefieldiae TaxID=38082 RepID=A0A899FMQ1_9ASCO|nr:hypothetical protein MERGE_002579 [Pneumocystis wakefieldiae]